MNNLKEYIIEKLKLNKSSKSESLFEVDSKCLEINYYEKNAFNMGLDPFCEISPCKITKKDSQEIMVEYNHLDGGPNTKFKGDYKEENNVLYLLDKDKQPVTIIFIGKDDALALLKRLKEHDKWIDFFKIYGDNKKGPKSVPVKSQNNVSEFIEDNKLEKYIEYLKEDDE